MELTDASGVELADIDLEIMDRALRQQRLAIPRSLGQRGPVTAPQHAVRRGRAFFEEVRDRDRKRVGDLHQRRGSGTGQSALQLTEETCRGAGQLAKLAQRQTARLPELLHPSGKARHFGRWGPRRAAGGSGLHRLALT